MDTNRVPPILSDEYWNCSVEHLVDTLQQFVSEFGSFTPEWFAEVKFHLLRQGLNLQSRNELCDTSLLAGTCKNCDNLYRTKQCLLWYRLFEIIDVSTVRRAPPCIRNALKTNQIKIVANFLKKASLINPPFYKARMPPRCPKMKDYGHCQPDEYCEAMETNRILEYNAARERVKLARTKRSPS